MIPQIIFSGVLFTLEGWSSKLSWLMLSRWSIGAYGSLANVNEMAPQASPANPALNAEMLSEIFQATPAYDATWNNLMLNWGVLIVHTLIYAIIALIVLRRKDIF
jgi:ABC transport system ATP-binding/permease protein